MQGASAAVLAQSTAVDDTAVGCRKQPERLSLLLAQLWRCGIASCKLAIKMLASATSEWGAEIYFEQI